MRKSRKQLLEELEQIKQDDMTLRILTKAYMRRNAELEDEIAVLNASIDCLKAEKDYWVTIAHKCDERRLEYVRNMATRD